MKNSDENPSTSFGQLAWVLGGAFGIGALGLVALGAALLLQPSDPDAPDTQAEKTLERPEHVQGADVGYRVWRATEPSRAASKSDSSRHKEATQDTRWVVMRPDVLEESTPHPDAGRPGSAPEAAGWSDPVNQRVLGPKSWMASVPEAEREAIERRLDTPIPARYPIDLRVREWSVDIVADVVQGCFGQAEPHGRFAVNYTLVADGARAVFEDVNLSNLYEIEDPTLVDCIVLNLSQRSFRSSEEGRMEVRQPFLFE